jgi:hypothetical protein
MKALTVQQPWAWAVTRGGQDFFMEPFAPKVRGYFLIHAGIGWDFNFERWLRSNGTVVPPVLPKAQLLGYTRLVSVSLRRLRGKTPQLPGPKFVFTITETTEIDQYVAAGRRGFWPVPRRILQELSLPEHVLNNPL